MGRHIHGGMELEDVAREAPVAIRHLTRKGVVCIQCGTPLWKTVEEAIRDAGVEDVEGMIAEVNRAIDEQK
ncbi:MAG TPA: hypothetical protein ENI92_05195 [Bacteroidetes bacterium]|nr:hypothetical protein [Bacteroidota bacterium]